jgi:hypothetical protein
MYIYIHIYIYCIYIYIVYIYISYHIIYTRVIMYIIYHVFFISYVDISCFDLDISCIRINKCICILFYFCMYVTMRMHWLYIYTADKLYKSQ